MDVDKNVGGRDRVVRAVLAVVLSILAVRWLKAGKKARGLLAGVGALGFGFNATTGYCGANDALDVDTTPGEVPGASETDSDFSTDVDADFSTEADTTDVETDTAATGETETTEEAEATTDGGLTCAFCGEPIKTGQRRGPNDQGQIVHDDCA
jgi:hypothetical protein